MMSQPESGEYENYNKTSKDYDTGRQAVGLEVFLGSIAMLTGGDMKKASLLDLGCGTGNYTCALSPYVGQITGIEFNSGMLEQCKRKTASLQNVKLMQGDATNIPLPNGYYDVVYATQMIHHLPVVDGDYVGFKKLLRESFRVLKDKGLIIINTDSQEQAEHLWLGAELAPIAGKQIAKRYPPLDLIISEFEKVGYKLQSINIHGFPSVYKPEILMDKDGPLSSHWRSLDSAWSLSPKEEVERAKTMWAEMQANGTLEEFFQKRTTLRQRVGETLTVIGYKNEERV